MGDKVERWRLRHDDQEHVVEIRDAGLRKEIRWLTDGAETATKRTSDERVTLDGDSLAVGVRLPALVGPARRVTLYAADGSRPAATSAELGLGGDDFVPEPGSKAAEREQWIRDHPGRYQALAIAGGIAKVVVPILLTLLVVRFAVTLPWPDISLPSIPLPDLPSIPWPSIPLPDLPSIGWPDWQVPGWVRWVADHAKYVVPVLIAWAIAAAEIRRRREQDAKRGKAEEASTGDEDGAS